MTPGVPRHVGAPDVPTGEGSTSCRRSGRAEEGGPHRAARPWTQRSPRRNGGRDEGGGSGKDAVVLGSPNRRRGMSVGWQGRPRTTAADLAAGSFLPLGTALAFPVDWPATQPDDVPADHSAALRKGLDRQEAVPEARSAGEELVQGRQGAARRWRARRTADPLGLRLGLPRPEAETDDASCCKGSRTVPGTSLARNAGPRRGGGERHHRTRHRMTLSRPKPKALAEPMPAWRVCRNAAGSATVRWPSKRTLSKVSVRPPLRP